MVLEPFPIFTVGNRHMVYDVNTVTYIRREHHVCGVLIGTIPHIPQQNVFLGIPLELMPEEARLLVENGHAYIVDDVHAHQLALANITGQERALVLETLQRQGRQAAKASQKTAQQKREKALTRLKDRDKGARITDAGSKDTSESNAPTGAGTSSDENLFCDSVTNASTQSIADSSPAEDLFYVTPTISYPLLPLPSSTESLALPAVPKSYPLFVHLHQKGYYVSPGLRFGCQYLVYPGDSLRFHSHFLANGVGWDDELDVLDIVGGGRLGTGVKKGFMIGGAEERKSRDAGGTADVSGKARAFCIEWASM